MIQNNIKHANAANIWDQVAGLHPSALERQNSRDPWLRYPSMFLYTALRHEANKRQLHQVMKAETWPYINESLLTEGHFARNSFWYIQGWIAIYCETDKRNMSIYSIQDAMSKTSYQKTSKAF